MKIGQNIILIKDIYDDGEGHHPPGYLAMKNEQLIIRSVNSDGTLGVSHAHIHNRQFIVYPNEFELIVNPADFPGGPLEYPEDFDDTTL